MIHSASVGMNMKMNYLFTCPVYQVQRVVLHEQILNIAPFNLHTLLHGNPNASATVNETIVSAVHGYLDSTSRVYWCILLVLKKWIQCIILCNHQTHNKSTLYSQMAVVQLEIKICLNQVHQCHKMYLPSMSYFTDFKQHEKENGSSNFHISVCKLLLLQ